MDVLHCDFETFSEAPIRDVGAIRYAQDPSTEILMLSYKLNGGPVELWDPFEDPFPPEDLIGYLSDPDVIVAAHNAQFERAVFAYVGGRQGLPSPDPCRYKCTAAKAAALALPRDLDGCSKILKVGEIKDKRGKELIKIFSVPQKPTKKNGFVTRYYPSDRPEEWEEFKSYCRQDTQVEYLIDQVMPDLHPDEQKVYLLDQELNFKGIPIDIPTVKKAMVIMGEYSAREVLKFREVTGGLNPTQRDKVKAWFELQGLALPNMQAATVDDAIAKVPPGPTLDALKIRRSLSRSSTAKLKKMVGAAWVDGRVRGTLLYHGATTGRWTGKIIQPQNLPRPTIKDTFTALEFLQNGTLEDVEFAYKDPMEAISSCIRHFICAPEGRELMVADYASIEARVVCWLAGQKSAIRNYNKALKAKGAFRRGELSKEEFKKIERECDPYISMAAQVFNIPSQEVTDDQRRLGKIIILACGFNMGVKTFIRTCSDWGFPVSDKLGKRGVYTYRNSYQMVSKFWDTIGTAAIRTVRDGRPRKAGEHLEFRVEGHYLMMVLPSGRKLSYPFPKVQKVTTPYGKEVDAVTFIGKLKGSVHWGRISTYGGMLAENATQAIARDLMAYGLMEAQKHPTYEVITSVHDEGVCELDEGAGTVTEFEVLLESKPEWAEDIPVVAEGYRSKRYKKG